MRVPILQVRVPKTIYFFMFYQVVSLMLIIGGLATSRWVEQGTDNQKWRGSLQIYQSGNLKWEGKTYRKISEQVCGLEGSYSDTYCVMFQDLHLASLVYIPCEVIFIVCTLVWIIITFRQACKIRPKSRWLLIIPVSIGWFAHMIGLIFWWKIAEGSFNGGCEQVVDSDSDRNKVCNKDGPAIGLSLSVLTLVLGVAYVKLNWKLKKKYIPEDDIINTIDY